jgi:hypothetical protein
MRELLIRVENDQQCRQLESFLRNRRARPRALGEHTLAVDLDEDNCPALATLVAAVEEWRGSSQAGEASLELDGEIRILRTEI